MYIFIQIKSCKIDISNNISTTTGVGYSTTQKLNQLGWQLCADLRDIPLTQLQTVLGKKLGETLQKYCRGVDNKPLIFGQVRLLLVQY